MTLKGLGGISGPGGRYFGAEGLSRTHDITYPAAAPTDPPCPWFVWGHPRPAWGSSPTLGVRVSELKVCHPTVGRVDRALCPPCSKVVRRRWALLLFCVCWGETRTASTGRCCLSGGHGRQRSLHPAFYPPATWGGGFQAQGGVGQQAHCSDPLKCGSLSASSEQALGFSLLGGSGA